MRKTISMILAAVMLCGMSGCSKNEEISSESEVSTVPESTKSSASESYDTSEIPSEADAELNDELDFEIELADHQITFPCKLKELEDIMVGLGKELTPIKLDNGGSADQFCMTYNGEDVGYIDVEINDITELSERTVVGIRIINKEGEIPVSYRGFTIGSDEQDILNELGDPDKNLFGSMSSYFIGSEGGIAFRYNKERKVYEIWLRTAVR